jgi:hypothetical protein
VLHAVERDTDGDGRENEYNRGDQPLARSQPAVALADLEHYVRRWSPEAPQMTFQIAAYVIAAAILVTGSDLDRSAGLHGPRTMRVDLFRGDEVGPRRLATNFARFHKEIVVVPSPDLHEVVAKAQDDVGEIAFEPVGGTVNCKSEGSAQPLGRDTGIAVSNN